MYVKVSALPRVTPLFLHSNWPWKGWIRVEQVHKVGYKTMIPASSLLVNQLYCQNQFVYLSQIVIRVLILSHYCVNSTTLREKHRAKNKYKQPWFKKNCMLNI